ncbi:hypothetical protein Dimus_018583 [Dionaea muscipula]
MAEVNNSEDPALHTKRGMDLSLENDPKKQKLEAPEKKIDDNGVEKHTEVEEIHEIEKRGGGDHGEGEREDDEAEEDEDEHKSSNGKEAVEIDRKGKGILVEEGSEEGEDEGDDSDDDDSSDGDDNLSDGDSDLSDDPLAEVDLDNILPSRTRRRVVHPGAYDANILAGAADDNDSDDSDA